MKLLAPAHSQRVVRCKLQHSRQADGISKLDFGKNGHFLALEMGPFYGPVQRRKKNPGQKKTIRSGKIIFFTRPNVQ